jgi:UDP-glucose 4-epimerase
MELTQKLSESGNFTVIGSSGYIGSKIVNKLTDLGCHVISASRKDTNSNIVAEFITADLGSLDFWLEIVQKSDFIIHLAGNTSINAANNNPALDLDTSVVPIYRLTEACKILQKRPRIVFASTVTTYGFTDDLPVSESTIECPETFYDLHKLFVERQCVLASNLNIFDGITLKLANVYGPSIAYSSAIDRGVLNKITELALNGKNLSLYGDGKYIRDYIYIDDVVDAFILACIASNSVGEVFNIGSGVGTTVRDAFRAVTQEVYRKTDKIIKIKDVPWPENSPNIDMRNFVASIDKANRYLGWYPKVSLQVGIAATVKSMILQNSMSPNSGYHK